MLPKRIVWLAAVIGGLVLLDSPLRAGIFNRKSSCKKANPCEAAHYAGQSGYHATTWRPWPQNQPCFYGDTAATTLESESARSQADKTRASTQTTKPSLVPHPNDFAEKLPMEKRIRTVEAEASSKPQNGSGIVEAMLILPVNSKAKRF